MALTATERARTAEDDDGPLVAAAQRDLAAFAELYDRYVTRVHRYHASRVGNIPEAEDLTAQTFLSALEAFPRYRHRGLFAAWLFSIARSKAMDHWRRRRPIGLEEIASQPAPDPASEAADQEGLQLLRAQLLALNDSERELIRLRYIAGLTFAQAAAVMGRTEAATKKAHSRLIARLRQEVEAEHE